MNSNNIRDLPDARQWSYTASAVKRSIEKIKQSKMVTADSIHIDSFNDAMEFFQLAGADRNVSQIARSALYDIDEKRLQTENEVNATFQRHMTALELLRRPGLVGDSELALLIELGKYFGRLYENGYKISRQFMDYLLG